mmetsp:Transcript_18846/g.56939  ORF Transcript_18846/g.56939 Transcript_18846/m.56939 type:complete len:215 (-) Transcript_18846:245-889(-)
MERRSGVSLQPASQRFEGSQLRMEIRHGPCRHLGVFGHALDAHQLCRLLLAVAHRLRRRRLHGLSVPIGRRREVTAAAGTTHRCRLLRLYQWRSSGPCWSDGGSNSGADGGGGAVEQSHREADHVAAAGAVAAQRAVRQALRAHAGRLQHCAGPVEAPHVVHEHPLGRPLRRAPRWTRQLGLCQGWNLLGEQVLEGHDGRPPEGAVLVPCLCRI